MVCIKTAIYTPFFIQSCYRTPNGYVKCKTTKLKKLDKGFHGGAGFNLKRFTDYDHCPTSFVYFGLTCVNFNDGSKAMTFYDAESICLEKQAVYFPSHQYQHPVFAIGMKEKATLGSVWIGMQKFDGRWYEANGNEVQPHMLNWATSEPSTNDDCVIADSSLK